MIKNPFKKALFIFLSGVLAASALLSGSAGYAAVGGLTPTLATPAATLDATQSNTSTSYYIVNNCVYNNVVHFTLTFNKGLDKCLPGSTTYVGPNDFTFIKLYIKDSIPQQIVTLDSTFVSQTGTGGPGSPIVLNFVDFKYTKDPVRTLEFILKSTALQLSTSYVLEFGPAFQGNAGDTLGKTYKYEFTTCSTTQIGLSSFTATPVSRKVVLEWTTASEIDNAGFNLYRAESENGEYVKINDELISAQGSSTEGASYEFVDEGLQNRTNYYYKLEDLDFDGQSTFHGPVKATPRWIYGNK